MSTEPAPILFEFGPTRCFFDRIRTDFDQLGPTSHGQRDGKNSERSLPNLAQCCTMSRITIVLSASSRATRMKTELRCAYMNAVICRARAVGCRDVPCYVYAHDSIDQPRARRLKTSMCSINHRRKCFGARSILQSARRRRFRIVGRRRIGDRQARMLVRT